MQTKNNIRRMVDGVVVFIRDNSSRNPYIVEGRTKRGRLVSLILSISVDDTSY